MKSVIIISTDKDKLTTEELEQLESLIKTVGTDRVLIGDLPKHPHV